MPDVRSGDQEQPVDDRRSNEQQQSGGPGGQQRSGASEQGSRTSPWEWAVAALSAALVLGTVGFLFTEAFNEPATPPKIEITVDTIFDTGSGYLVEFTAYNRGQTTAATLMVEGELKSETEEGVEKAQITLDYVPSESRRRAGLLFTRDPRRYELEIHPKGYDVP